MNTWTIIILGATGDLARTRLIPALYDIIKHEENPTFAFIGAAKDEVSISSLIHTSLPHGEADFIKKFLERSSYSTIDFTDPASFETLADHITEVEKRGTLSGNRLVYFSISSTWFCTVTKLLHQFCIIQKNAPHRIVYEKPFGSDAQSAQKIQECIASLLDESQIYRVDHYTSKALVTSLLLTRFSNIFFEPLWNAEYIEQILITLTETETLEGRGEFYDQYGALKDVVQNHILQLVAYTALDKPPSFDPETVSKAKAHILKHTKFTDGLLGQYRGYTTVPGVAADSSRETFALLRAEISTPRWKNVPIFIKTGKALNHKSTEIHIIFKPQTMKLSASSSNTFESNRVIIRISPDSAILLRLNAQKRSDQKILPISMEFCYRCTFGAEQPHSYETLFLDVMAGDKSAAVSLDEIASSWDCITTLKNLPLPLHPYEPGTEGPQEIKAFTANYAIMWDVGAQPAVPSSLHQY